MLTSLNTRGNQYFDIFIEELDELNAANQLKLKIFTKNDENSLSIEFIKGCLLGTAKTIIVKCLKFSNDDFPIVESKLFYFFIFSFFSF